MPQHVHLDEALRKSAGPTRPLLLALGVTLAFAIVELVGGVLSGSLALVSDSGHMFTDVLALALSLWAGLVATRIAGEKQTFGFLRVEILVALINGAALALISVLLIYEALQRIQSPVPIDAPLMLGVAALGLMANIVGALILRQGAKKSLNVQGAFLHILGDLLSSIGVIVSALLIIAFGLTIADPVISIAIAIIILYSSWRVISQSTLILLEFTPSYLDMSEVRTRMMKVPGVVDVHDVHAWTLGSGVVALSAHVQVEDQPVSSCSCIIKDCEALLRQEFKIVHTTLQIEYEACEGEICVFRRPGGAHAAVEPEPHEHDH